MQQFTMLTRISKEQPEKSHHVHKLFHNLFKAFQSVKNFYAKRQAIKGEKWYCLKCYNFKILVSSHWNRRTQAKVSAPVQYIKIWYPIPTLLVPLRNFYLLVIPSAGLLKCLKASSIFSHLGIYHLIYCRVPGWKDCTNSGCKQKSHFWIFPYGNILTNRKPAHKEGFAPSSNLKWYNLHYYLITHLCSTCKYRGCNF